jgi:hypothetical protein
MRHRRIVAFMATHLSAVVVPTTAPRNAVPELPEVDAMIAALGSDYPLFAYAAGTPDHREDDESEMDAVIWAAMIRP